MRKLEIGAGGHSQKVGPEWLHQDIRELEGIDVVCDAHELPFSDGSFGEVFSSHVIEHMGWRNVRGVLLEWLRVLRSNGTLEMITPDFFRLWENLVTKRDLPKSDKWRGGPVDSGFVAYVTGGGQDYPENTHTAHYIDTWYHGTLEELGCDVVIKYLGEKHPSPSIRIIAVKK